MSDKDHKVEADCIKEELTLKKLESEFNRTSALVYANGVKLCHQYQKLLKELLNLAQQEQKRSVPSPSGHTSKKKESVHKRRKVVNVSHDYIIIPQTPVDPPNSHEIVGRGLTTNETTDISDHTNDTFNDGSFHDNNQLDNNLDNSHESSFGESLTRMIKLENSPVTLPPLKPFTLCIPRLPLEKLHNYSFDTYSDDRQTDDEDSIMSTEISLQNLENHKYILEMMKDDEEGSVPMSDIRTREKSSLNNEELSKEGFRELHSENLMASSRKEESLSFIGRVGKRRPIHVISDDDEEENNVQVKHKHTTEKVGDGEEEMEEEEEEEINEENEQHMQNQDVGQTEESLSFIGRVGKRRPIHIISDDDEEEEEEENNIQVKHKHMTERVGDGEEEMEEEEEEEINEENEQQVQNQDVGQTEESLSFIGRVGKRRPINVVSDDNEEEEEEENNIQVKHKHTTEEVGDGEEEMEEEEEEEEVGIEKEDKEEEGKEEKEEEGNEENERLQNQDMEQNEEDCSYIAETPEKPSPEMKENILSSLSSASYGALHHNRNQNGLSSCRDLSSLLSKASSQDPSFNRNVTESLETTTTIIREDNMAAVVSSNMERVEEKLSTPEIKKPRIIPKKRTTKSRPPPVVNQSNLSILDLTSSRLGMSFVGLRRRTLLNSKLNTTSLLHDTFDDEAKPHISRTSIRLSHTNYIAPKLKMSKYDKQLK